MFPKNKKRKKTQKTQNVSLWNIKMDLFATYWSRNTKYDHLVNLYIGLIKQHKIYTYLIAGFGSMAAGGNVQYLILFQSENFIEIGT